MSRRVFALSLVLALGAAVAGPARAEDAAAILKKADEVRNPSDSYRLKILVTTEGQDDTELDVSIKGKDKTFVKTLRPARDKGRNMLMLGEDMWLVTPKTKRPVRVSLNQKLTGQAANGDITRQRWSGDYEPTLEKEADGQWVLLLTAERDGLTYDKIRLWVDQKTFRPVHAEYLTKAGKVMKRARFEGYKKIAGAIRPTETTITSATRESDKSVVTILEMESARFPDTLFNQLSLK